MPSYHRVSVKFECSTDNNTKVNRAVLTVYGDSEFVVLREQKRQYPEYTEVTILECEWLS